MLFVKWLDTLIEEKNIDVEQSITVDGPSGENYMTLDMVIDAIKSTNSQEQRAIKNMIVKIDFVNGDIVDYFKHLAKGLAL